MKNKQMPAMNIIGIGVTRKGTLCGFDITKVTSMKIGKRGVKFEFNTPMKLDAGDTIELVFEFKGELTECSS